MYHDFVLFFSDAVSHGNSLTSQLLLSIIPPSNNFSRCDQAAAGLSEFHSGGGEGGGGDSDGQRGDANPTAAAGNAALVTGFPIVISTVTGTPVCFARQSFKKKKRQTG